MGLHDTREELDRQQDERERDEFESMREYHYQSNAMLKDSPAFHYCKQYHCGGHGDETGECFDDGMAVLAGFSIV